MALRKKPQPVSEEVIDQVPEQVIDQAISKGGTVATEAKRRKTSNFPLRFVHADIPERIDESRNKRPIAPSINTWINEAILEKLEREKQHGVTMTSQ
jgi:hypothetical protein